MGQQLLLPWLLWQCSTAIIIDSNVATLPKRQGDYSSNCFWVAQGAKSSTASNFCCCKSICSLCKWTLAQTKSYLKIHLSWQLYVNEKHGAAASCLGSLGNAVTNLIDANYCCAPKKTRDLVIFVGIAQVLNPSTIHNYSCLRFWSDT